MPNLTLAQVGSSDMLFFKFLFGMILKLKKGITHKIKYKLPEKLIRSATHDNRALGQIL